MNGIAKSNKRNTIFYYLRKLNLDIICLQETHGSNTTEEWTKEWGGKAYWSNGTCKSRGTAILFKTGTNFDISDIKTDVDGRILSINAKTDDVELNIMSVYAPIDARERKDFFGNIEGYITKTQYTVIAGDFNCVSNIILDKQGGNPHRGLAGNDELTKTTENLKIKDIWRSKHPAEKQYTWKNANLTIRSRLDKIYISEDLVEETTTAEIKTCPYSDHNMVTTTMTIPKANSRGPGYWKMNTTILTDKQYNIEMTAYLKLWTTEKQRFGSLTPWWEKGKENIKRITIKHSARIRRQNRKEEKDLTDTLQKLEQQQILDKEEVERVRKEIRRLTETREKGAQIRSKAKWIEEGEKPTKYFFNLEKQTQPRNAINELEINNKTYTTNVEILEGAREFYQKLYTAEETDLDDQIWLTDQLEKKLDDLSREQCEGPLTTDEITKAVKKMQNNKTPGPDGIPKEFYKHFWDLLKEHMTDVYNENFDIGNMTESQQEAILRLLYKKDQKKFLKNWRPISLLNVDYKIAAAAIADRLRKVLPTLIHEDQTCGIPNRSIYENLFRLRDMINNTRTNNTNMILVGLDQEKAFDRVDRRFLDRILQQMNFGPSFKHWIKVLYAGAKSQIINNGWLSDPVNLERGLRQGCPLSPLLYVLVAETLGQAIRNERKIQGIAYPGANGQTSKLVQYADDTTLTLKDDLSVLRSFDIISRFESGSGSKLNITKTEGTFVGQQAGKTQGPVPITWREDNITVLGTMIGQNTTQNWNKTTEKLEKKLEIWSSRKLSIKGRAVLIKTYALATIIYLATTFRPPRDIITRINKAIFKFLWQGRTELINRTTMCMTQGEGGLGIPNIDERITAIRTKPIKTITDKNNLSLWITWPRYYIGTSLSTIKTEWNFLRDNNKPRADPNNVPKWYKEMAKVIKENKTTFETWNQQQITSKNIYDNIRTIETPKAEERWQRVYQGKIDFKETWKNIWKTPNTNTEKEIIWKTTHRVLVTKELLTKWKIKNMNAKCPFCNETEDINHALIKCKRIQHLWKEVQKILNKIQDRTYPVNLMEIVFMQTSPTDEVAKMLTRYITTVAIAVIWENRNRKVYHNEEITSNLYDIQRKKMKDRITLDLVNKKEDKLKNFWSFKKTLCEYKENEKELNWLI